MTPTFISNLPFHCLPAWTLLCTESNLLAFSLTLTHWLRPHKLVKQSTVTRSSPGQILCAFEGNGFELLTPLSWNHLSLGLSSIPTGPREKLTRVLENSTLDTRGDWEGHSCSPVPTDPRSPLFPHQLVSTAGPTGQVQPTFHVLLYQFSSMIPLQQLATRGLPESPCKFLLTCSWRLLVGSRPPG